MGELLTQQEAVPEALREAAGALVSAQSWACGPLYSQPLTTSDRLGRAKALVIPLQRVGRDVDRPGAVEAPPPSPGCPKYTVSQLASIIFILVVQDPFGGGTADAPGNSNFSTSA